MESLSLTQACKPAKNLTLLVRQEIDTCLLLQLPCKLHKINIALEVLHSQASSPQSHIQPLLASDYTTLKKAYRSRAVSNVLSHRTRSMQQQPRSRVHIAARVSPQIQKHGGWKKCFLDIEARHYRPCVHLQCCLTLFIYDGEQHTHRLK